MVTSVYSQIQKNSQDAAFEDETMRTLLTLWRHWDQFRTLADSIEQRRGFFLIPEGSPMRPIDVAAVLRRTMPEVSTDYGFRGGACLVTLAE